MKSYRKQIDGEEENEALITIEHAHYNIYLYILFNGVVLLTHTERERSTFTIN